MEPLPGPDSPPAPVPPQKAHDFPLVVLCLAILIALGVFGWGYVTGRIAFTAARPNEVASTTTPAADTSPLAVSWKNILNAKPIITSPIADANDPTITLKVFAIGTVTSGAYANRTLYLAMLDGTDEGTGSGSFSENYYPYFYYVGDDAGKALAWWGAPDNNGYYDAMEQIVGAGGPDMQTLSAATMPEQISLDAANTYNTQAGYGTIYRASPAGLVAAGEYLEVPESSNAFIPAVPITTVDGDQVLADTVPGNNGTPPAKNYFIALPYGYALSITGLMPDFFDSTTGIPQVSWRTGNTTTTFKYNYDRYAYGVSDCYDQAGVESGSSLIETGTTENGDPVYELNPNDTVAYQCFYEKTVRYDFDPATDTSTPHYDATFDEFMKTHPVFFWKHPFGDIITFVREDVTPAAEKAKPVIYLYPTKTERVSVRVAPEGGFTKTDPAYRGGWNVLAAPDGALSNLVDGKSYPYLFWEGGAAGVVPTPAAGFVVKREAVQSTLEEKLTLMGLNNQERKDFEDFWVPKLSSAPYYFITFDSRSDIDRTAPLTVTPTPDTVIRVLMDYRPLAAPINVPPLHIETPARAGFTVVEWGGVLRN